MNSAHTPLEVEFSADGHVVVARPPEATLPDLECRSDHIVPLTHHQAARVTLVLMLAVPCSVRFLQDSPLVQVLKQRRLKI